MIRFTEWYVGIDCGVRRDPSAICVLSRCAPLPEDITSGPVLEIADLARAKAVPFPAVASEVKRVVELLDGTVTVGLDGTGAGEGLAQELRRQGVRCVSMQMGGGSARVIRRRDRWSGPSHVLYENIYQLLVQRRLRMNPSHPLTSTLVEELDSCTVGYTATGNVRYEVPRSTGAHGDLLVALGVACTLHEVPHASMVTAQARRLGPDRVIERKSGNRHYGSRALAVIEQRRAESYGEAERYREAERERFREAGWTT